MPLPEATFHILMAVAEDDRHGYAIIQEVARRTDGMLKLSPGTLYRSIQRMLEQGLIQETAERPAPAGRVYQVWVVTAQSAVSAGLLLPDPSGGATVFFETPADIPPPMAIAVTLEPAGGMPAPTGDKYLVGNPL